jgi:lysophospholipase L1-like esterase
MSLQTLVKLVAFNTFCILILLFGAELYCRWKAFHTWHYPQMQYAYDPLLKYKYNPNHPQTLGGFKGGPIALEKKLGTLRLFCLGGSTTAGYELPFHEAWPYRLQFYLTERYKTQPVEVINAAVDGYGSKHIILQILNILPAYHPDYLIIHTGWNGLGILSDSLAWTPPNVFAPQDNRIERFDKYLQNHCYLYLSRMRWRVEEFLQKKANHAIDERQLHDANYGVTWKKALSQIDSAAKSIGAIPIYLQFPGLERGIQLRGDVYSEMIHQRLEWIGDLRKENSAKVIDLRETFSFASEAKQDTYYYFDLMHMRAEGCDVFARTLADSLMHYFP